jgi:Tfp pilus assembly pilus retraction ATPase PilT
MSPAQAIERIAAMVPPEHQKGITAQLATTVEAIISQRLATTKDGHRRPAVEILRGNPFIARCILEHRMNDLTSYLGSRQAGMQRFDQHLIEMHQAGLISGTEAMRLASDPEAVAVDLRRASSA